MRRGSAIKDLDIVGIALHINVLAGLHIGLVYRVLDKMDPKIIHLAWHRDLRDEVFSNYITGGDVPSSALLVWEEVGLTENNRLYLRAAIKKIVDNHKRDHRDPRKLVTAIDYGINPAGCTFDPETLKYSANGKGVGLTCATFILAVLAARGLNLFDHATWQVREEDIHWQQEIVGHLESRFPGDVERISAMKQDIGQIYRFRPEEVGAIASGVPPKWPVPFVDASELGAKFKAAIFT